MRLLDEVWVLETKCGGLEMGYEVLKWDVRY